MTTFADSVAVEDLVATVDHGRKQTHMAYVGLMKKIAVNQVAGAYEIAQWVFNNAAADFAELDPELVPSRGALRLLRLIKENDKEYANFVRNIWAKTIPSKSLVEMEGRMVDDGRSILSTLATFQKSFEAVDQQ